MIPVLEERASEGSLPPSEVAMLVDRVRVQDGTPQRYGTQFSVEDERLVLDPVEDPEGLDERRRRMGLPPMETYVEMLEDAYDMPVSVDSVPSS